MAKHLRKYLIIYIIGILIAWFFIDIVYPLTDNDFFVSVSGETIEIIVGEEYEIRVPSRSSLEGDPSTFIVTGTDPLTIESELRLTVRGDRVRHQQLFNTYTILTVVSIDRTTDYTVITFVISDSDIIKLSGPL